MPPNPLENEESYNSIVLAGQASPGVVTLSGHDDPVNWDVKEGNAQSGATMTRKGAKPRTFTASFYLADLEDINTWQAFLDLINSTVSGPAPKALDVYHPDLATQSIKSVVKDTVMGTVHDGKGGQTIAVKFIEYRPPKPSGGTPSGSGTSNKKTNDPNDAALAELAALTTQYQQTPFGWKEAA